MKVALLSSASSIHTTRWANALTKSGIEVHLISCHQPKHALNDNVKLHILPHPAPIGYFSAIRSIRRLLRKIQPDLLNAHYATGYGTLARLSKFKPLLLSVWGSDVYDFPEMSSIHRRLLRSNLKAATALASTSHCMAKKTSETYEHEHVYITPFGIDEDRFHPTTKKEVKKTITIGTVKTLSPKYGIDTLIHAFSKVYKEQPSRANLKLEIAGGGPDRDSLERLVDNLKIRNAVTFYGAIPHDQIPQILERFDIYASLSRLDSESFGVAILEASSAGLPVVVSDADGPAEVTIDGVTGIIVKKDNPNEAADALEKLVANRELREKLGANGRKHVLDHYTWNSSIDTMISAFGNTLKLHSGSKQ